MTTYYVLATGLMVCGVALLGRWLVRLLSAPEYFGAYKALPWLALGWALYGLYPVLMVLAGRAGNTTRNFPAAAAGLAVNVALLLLLVPKGGANLGIAGAGLALCGAYIAMLTVLYTLTRSLFHVAFDWPRLALLVAIFASVAVSGELLLPTSGFGGFALRVLWFMLAPALLIATRFFTARELRGARDVVRSAGKNHPAGQALSPPQAPLDDSDLTRTSRRAYNHLISLPVSVTSRLEHIWVWFVVGPAVAGLRSAGRGFSGRGTGSIPMRELVFACF